MAAPYCTVEQLRALEGAARALALLDFDEDGSEGDEGDSGTGNVDPFEAVGEDTDTSIDARLGTRFVVPFASLTSTPAQVQQLAKWGRLAELYERLAPEGADAKKWRKKFDDALSAYAKGTWAIPAATLITDTATAARPMTHESAGTVYAGRIDDDYTDSGVDKTYGM